ncbi:MAG: hypothetical protein QXI18_03760 [Nitrososphaerota archaeon]|uniref:hypothetical protein n=1 Tax=Pyrobaculum sp. TaxID=2004705 RepID=UPI00316053DE
MRLPYAVLLVLTGLVAAFMTYVGASGLDLIISVFVLIYWIVALFMTPLPRPLNRVHAALSIILLAIFAYLAAMRILAVLRL